MKYKFVPYIGTRDSDAGIEYLNAFINLARDHKHNKGRECFSIPENFDDLYGKLFKDFVNSSTYKKHFIKSLILLIKTIF